MTEFVKICSICRKISGTGRDHTDCIQKRRIELEDDELKSRLPERLDMSKTTDLGAEVRAIMEHLAKEKDKAERDRA